MASLRVSNSFKEPVCMNGTELRPQNGAAVPHSLAFMPQLHSLRALCILAVIYTHYFAENRWPLGIFWGGLGVRCFFVLSGFLITSILIRESDAASSFKSMYVSFILRRGFRLYPVLLVTLVASAILGISAVRDGFLWHVTYLSNFYVIRLGAWPGPAAPLWSLAVEEQFYLFWPFIIYFGPRRLLPALLPVVIAAAPIFRLGWRFAGLGDFGAWVLPPANFDALAIGAMLALYKERNKTIWLMVGLTGLSIWLTLVWSPVGGWSIFVDSTAADSAAAMVFAGVIAHLAKGIGGLLGKTLDSSVLRYVGTISYGIYVLHGFVPYYLESLGVPNFLPHSLFKLISIGTTIALASMSWHFLERPVMRFGQRAIGRRKVPEELELARFHAEP